MLFIQVEQKSPQESLGASLDQPVSTGPSPRVNVYAATYESGKPFQGPTTVLLKEFTPNCRRIGVNELQLARVLKVPSQLSDSKAVLSDTPYARHQRCTIGQILLCLLQGIHLRVTEH